ncbi:MAG: dihydroxy-acid dehydratase, partial [Frankia sp.]
SIASRAAFINALAVDMAMGGSTNTVLHLLAAAVEAGVDVDQDDIDALSRRIPCLCKVAPSSEYHMEDVHRAGGIPAIMGELDRAGLLDRTVHSVHAPNLTEFLAGWDVRRDEPAPAATELYLAAPGGVRTIEPFSSTNRWTSLDLDDKNGCIRSVEHAYSPDGGLAILRGSLAPDGAVIKTAGVEAGRSTFRGPAVVLESQDEAVDAILNKRVKAGDVLVIRYEGPRGGPGMQEMLYPTTFLKARGLGPLCALVTDGRFSGGSSGLSIGHVSPEAAHGGPIALVRDGDLVDIDIPGRRMNLLVDDGELTRRRAELEAGGGYRPRNRDRVVSPALRAYAAMATSAATGAARDVSLIERP